MQRSIDLGYDGLDSGRRLHEACKLHLMRAWQKHKDKMRVYYDSTLPSAPIYSNGKTAFIGWFFHGRRAETTPYLEIDFENTHLGSVIAHEMTAIKPGDAVVEVRLDEPTP